MYNYIVDGEVSDEPMVSVDSRFPFEIDIAGSSHDASVQLFLGRIGYEDVTIYNGTNINNISIKISSINNFDALTGNLVVKVETYSGISLQSTTVYRISWMTTESPNIFLNLSANNIPDYCDICFSVIGKNSSSIW